MKNCHGGKHRTSSSSAAGLVLVHEVRDQFVAPSYFLVSFRVKAVFWTCQAFASAHVYEFFDNVWAGLCVECYVLDAEWFPDVLLHVFFKRGTVETTDEDADPVIAVTVFQTCSGLEEKRGVIRCK